LGQDKIGIKVRVEDGAPSYIMSSNGQGRRADLCVASAFRAASEGGEKINYMAIDEFDSGLDPNGVDAFADFLKREAEEKESIFVITHNPNMAGQFENAVVVKRAEGKSELVEV
jgi:DNA repair exonuclease SbcCD ATPase subunit